MLIKFFSGLFLTILMATNLKSQNVIATLDYSILKNERLIISLIITNKSPQRYYIIGNFKYLELDDYIRPHVNYGSFEKWVRYEKTNAINFLKKREKESHIDDIYTINLPITKERFQMTHNCNEMDIFEIISNLMNAYSIINFDSCEFDNRYKTEQEEFSDNFLFELSKQLNPRKDYELINFYKQAITLQPYETKTIFIDLSYLLQQKATYLLSFNYKSNDNWFKKERQILQKMGFKHFKGEITSNIIEIKSSR